jgi:hypothetical protein
MTADGSVVGITLSGQAGFGSAQISPAGVPAGNKHAYIPNSHGWFHFSSILAAHGIDLVAQGWDPANLAITGIRTIDGVDLVYGQGRRREIVTFANSTVGYSSRQVEGYVAVLPQGLLASFNPQPVPQADGALVGVWLSDPTSTIARAFMPDGTYYRITSAGYERGLYSWAGNGAGGAYTITTLHDTDGTGHSSLNGHIGLSYTVSGDVATFSDAACLGCTPFVPTYRVPPDPASLVGGWIAGNAAEANNSSLMIFLDNGRFFFAQDVLDDAAADGPDSFEFDLSRQGTFTWDPGSGLLTMNGNPQALIVLTPNGLGATVYSEDNTVLLHLRRIIDPATVAVVQGGSATATLGAAFSYQVAATNAQGFGASGLPQGLGIHPTSGIISGTPEAAGVFPVTVFATNAFGNPKSATLDLTVSAGVVVVVGPGTNVSVTPDVPPGTPPMTLNFDNVETGGTTTVALVDANTAPPPPSGFQIGTTPLYYEIASDVVLAPGTVVTICFDYAGVDFGEQTPRLFHFEDGVWVDITTSVDAATTTLCGATSSFSPFAIFSSPAPFTWGTGFYAPLTAQPRAMNAARAGSAVPLKFNVYVNGETETDPAGLEFSATSVTCPLAPEDPVDYVTSASTGLRWDATAGQFILNWKTPRQPGCYEFRITGGGRALLTASIRLR